MAQFQNMNQFSQTPNKGNVAAIPNPVTISCQISPNSSNTLYPGSVVKLVAGNAFTILVDKMVASDVPFGFVVWNPKKSVFVAGDAVEVALPSSIIYAESSAAFNRGQNLEYVATGDKVAANAGSNSIVGVALDTSSGANQLVRVLVRTVAEFSSSSSSSSCKSSSSSSSSSSA